MKVLIVARCKNGWYAPFITEQVEALQKAGVECRYFGVKKNGYFKQINSLKSCIKEFKPDIIHAHYGLCGLFATIQCKVPVVTTYHGSDINNPKVLKLSKIAIKRSAFNIFVSQKNVDAAKPKGHYSLIPCGIDLDDYQEMSREDARKYLGLEKAKKYILFAGAFDNPVKNASLAKEAVARIDGAELLELKGYSRQQVSALYYAVDTFLMTSITEGSPQVIKEALACGCPIVSVDVGDVKLVIDGVDGCYIARREINAIAEALKMTFDFSRTESGRNRIESLKLENSIIAQSIIDIYKTLI